MALLKYCTKCWMPETRPRITFNSEGVCCACEWAEEKKRVDWDERRQHLEKLCATYRKDGKSPDVVVPYSGGKDSIYVAHKMRDLGMTPLLMTVIPHMETETGAWNRKNMCPDMERYEINLNEEKYRSLAKKYFIEQGRPKHPWECAISAAVINQAYRMGIPFIMYGEEGEAEYGGSMQEKDRWMHPASLDYLMQFYYQCGQLDWTMPDEDGYDKMYFTQYSRYENWSPSKHANYAIAAGMRTIPVRNIGTFTSHSQISDDLQDLHAYLMFVKYGFGRATSDASIAIREGWTDRDSEAIQWVETYDGEFPNAFLPKYLEYFNMTEAEFSGVIAKHANRNLLERTHKYIWALQPWLSIWRRKDTKLAMINPSRYSY